MVAERRPAEVARGIGHAADGGAEADDIAPGGGIAERAAGVGAAGDGHHAAGERDRCTAGGAAAGFREVVGIVGCAEDTVEGLRAGTELGDVGFAEEDGAGGAHARDEQVVLGGDVVLEEGRAEGGADAGGFDEVLVGDGQTVQRTEGFATRLHLVGAGCGCGCLVGDERDDGVDLRIDAIDLLEVLGKSFASRKLLGADQGRHLDRRGEAE